MLSNSLMKKNPRTRDLEKTRSEILNAAFDQFFRNGFHATSLDQILAQTNLTKGALFHQFSSKLDLGYAVVDEVLTKMIADRWIDPLSAFENPLMGVLHQLHLNIGKASQRNLNLGCPLNNLVQEMSNSDQKFQRHLSAALKFWIEGIESHIERGKKNGFIKASADSRAVAEYIVMSHEGYYGLIKGLRNKGIFKALVAGLEIYFGTIAANSPKK